jgi:2-(1,2-epoxy-1,2-dihydrophenyl)acetyl-CoA isomerase
MTEELIERVEHGVSWITLNRPDVGNAITPAQRSRILEVLTEADDRADVRCVVLGATGKHFCTGADLTVNIPSGEDGGPAPATAIMRNLAEGAQRLIAKIMDCQKPVIASVGGTAAGAGAHLAFACDLVVAAEPASFIEVFVRRGLAPDGGGAYLLPRLVGLQRAKELVFLGDRITAADAAALGLVNRVVPTDELAATVSELAARLASGPTIAIGLAKRLLNRSFETDRDGAFLEEAMAVEIVTRTEDATEGIASFIERRPASFKGL